MPEPLLKISNHHSGSCGDPPIIADDKDTYIGYFENEHGEQWVFTFNRKTKKAELRGGDIGWNEVCEIGGDVAGPTLNKAEELWLQACLFAVTSG
jgi:hypothetical protein